MKYGSKDEVVARMSEEHARLTALLEGFAPAEREAPGLWGDGWTLKDLVAHLAAWHALFLRWHAEGLAGREPDMPAPGYRWNETPRLNRAIQAEHADRAWDDVRRDFERSHREILALVAGLTETELLEPGHFAWTGRNPLTTYLGANTVSHYRFAAKVIARRRRRTGTRRARNGPG